MADLRRVGAEWRCAGLQRTSVAIVSPFVGLTGTFPERGSVELVDLPDGGNSGTDGRRPDIRRSRQPNPGVLLGIVLADWPLRWRAGAAMLWCVSCFGGFTIAFGLSRNVALSMVALVLAGACDMVSVIVRHTLVQLSTPDDMRGRVSAVNMV